MLTPKWTVLLVEDDADLRSLYRRHLIAAGYIVNAVGDGLDALRHLETQIPDLVVLDLALPCLDGRDVFRELKARGETRHVPVVVVTGATDTSDLRDEEFACVLIKPIHMDALIEAMDRCVRPAQGAI